LRFFRRFLDEERAQATIEYILMLAFLVGFCAMFVNHLIRPLFRTLANATSHAFDNALFPRGGDGFHHFRVGR
jgi:hypothetical protein